MAHAEDYVPRTPPVEPSIAGSVATSVCDGDVPYIVYDVVLTDPDNKATSHTAYLTLSGGGQTETFLLGEIVDGTLSGSMLWPGASVGPNGEPTGWPGWMQIDGTWVQTDGNFGWTRGVTSAEITVNPETTVPLSYPAASPNCVMAPPGTDPTPPGSTTTSASGTGLAETGVSPVLLPLGVGSVLVILAGLVFFLARRRTSTR
ncbi:hypothetical protein ASC59_12220 [Leifsonia sp. Root1293]|nr:hypothetical protein ASC59_12220 [Leifsonia sp. Root1293]KRA08632.1 hypothetical protein ASD61_12220 [Leifsonia sp. Root60]